MKTALYLNLYILGSLDGKVGRFHTFHQAEGHVDGIPELNQHHINLWLSLLVILILALKFFLYVYPRPGFDTPTENSSSNFQFDLETVDKLNSHSMVHGCPTACLFIYSSVIFFLWK